MCKATRIKISDGDMMVVTLGGDDINHQTMVQIRDNFKKWLVSRGLTNVELGVIRSHSNDDGMTITVLSVNDVFEDTVLNERTKQET